MELCISLLINIVQYEYDIIMGISVLKSSLLSIFSTKKNQFQSFASNVIQKRKKVSKFVIFYMFKTVPLDLNGKSLW